MTLKARCWTIPKPEFWLELNLNLNQYSWNMLEPEQYLNWKIILVISTQQSGPNSYCAAMCQNCLITAIDSCLSLCWPLAVYLFDSFFFLRLSCLLPLRWSSGAWMWTWKTSANPAAWLHFDGGEIGTVEALDTWGHLVCTGIAECIACGCILTEAKCSCRLCTLQCQCTPSDSRLSKLPESSAAWYFPEFSMMNNSSATWLFLFLCVNSSQQNFQMPSLEHCCLECLRL